MRQALKQKIDPIKSFLKAVKWKFRGKWIPTGLGVSLLTIAGISGLSYQNTSQLTQDAAQIQRYSTALARFSHLAVLLADTESRQANYLLHRDPDDLAQYQSAVERLEPEVVSIRPLLSDAQQRRLDDLNILIVQRVSLFQRSLDSQRTSAYSSGLDPLVAEIGQNRQAVRRSLSALEVELQAESNRYNQQIHDRLVQRRWLEGLIGGLTLVMVLSLFALVVYQKRKRQQAETRQISFLQAKLLSELKLQFFSMVSHEFRTPLSHILGSTQLLEEALKSQVDPAKLKNLYRIQSSARLLTQLLNDVLTLARADAGKLEYNPTRIELQSFCLNLIEDLQVSNEVERSLIFSPQGSRTHAWADEKLLTSILGNLLSNAIKYSPTQSSIYLTLISEADLITFVVRDEGIGIPQEDLPRLYNPFIRGRNSRQTMGTGLGLALVKKCLDLHGGEITVDSQVGVGTTFTVKIPQTNGS